MFLSIGHSPFGYYIEANFQIGNQSILVIMTAIWLFCVSFLSIEYCISFLSTFGKKVSVIPKENILIIRCSFLGQCATNERRRRSEFSKQFFTFSRNDTEICILFKNTIRFDQNYKRIILSDLFPIHMWQKYSTW